MRIYQNFTILISVYKEEKEIKLSSSGRKIEDELEKIKRRIFIENMLSK